MLLYISGLPRFMFTAYCGGRLTFKHECFGVAAVGVTAGGRLDVGSALITICTTPRFWRIFSGLTLSRQAHEVPWFPVYSRVFVSHCFVITAEALWLRRLH